MSRRFFIHGSPQWTERSWNRSLSEFAELLSLDLAQNESDALKIIAARMDTSIGSCCVFRRALHVWAGEAVE